LQMNRADDGSNVNGTGWSKVERRRRRPSKDNKERVRGKQVTHARYT
jgi:hypothetical protein